MTKEQIELAIKMNDNGIEWQTIAIYFKVSYHTLLKSRKQYESMNVNVNV